MSANSNDGSSNSPLSRSCILFRQVEWATRSRCQQVPIGGDHLLSSYVCQPDKRSPIDKRWMEEAPSGAASLDDKPPIPMIHANAPSFITIVCGSRILSCFQSIDWSSSELKWLSICARNRRNFSHPQTTNILARAILNKQTVKLFSLRERLNNRPDC